MFSTRRGSPTASDGIHKNTQQDPYHKISHLYYRRKDLPTETLLPTRSQEADGRKDTGSRAKKEVSRGTVRFPESEEEGAGQVSNSPCRENKGSVRTREEDGNARQGGSNEWEMKAQPGDGGTRGQAEEAFPGDEETRARRRELHLGHIDTQHPRRESLSGND
ncbi:hypothetical protein NDU88_011028 [Pleurodeles waltl]|uniref:Uncharacterized protein n=1 Tax=Pleurodeles waltl TaxID=8319 RepID=A0AAV7R065_PLEWA|nr:hypothetical protein NDU88_011028 [Pleurodeles waltl]